MSSSRPLGPGDQLGPYRVVRELGRGGMGTVYEALDVGLNRSVALKVITHALGGDPAFRARFTQEAQAQASLDSAHVVTVFAYGEVDGRLYIASQLIPDGDLGAMFRAHGAPPPQIALSMMAQIADGLAEAHRVGLIHRDIKPANVLLRNRGSEITAYLADFGIARRLGPAPGVSGLTTEGFAVGTPSYMAPELHTGGAPGPASDIYSLGCLLWACLTGRAPYGGTTDYQIVTAHVSAPVPQLAGTTPYERELNRILAAAMAKDPRQRYPSASALRDDLRAVERSFAAPAEVTGRVATGPGAGRPGATGPTGPTGAGGGSNLSAAPAGRGSGARPGLIVAAAVALSVVLGVGIGAAFALTGGDSSGDDPNAGPSSAESAASTDGTAEPTGEPTDDPTDPDTAPTGTASPDPDLDPEEEQVVANLTAALVGQGDIDRPTAMCVARELVVKHGVDGLQKSGFIDADLRVVEGSGGAPDADLLADVFTLAFDCVLGSSGL